MHDSKICFTVATLFLEHFSILSLSSSRFRLLIYIFASRKRWRKNNSNFEPMETVWYWFELYQVCIGMAVPNVEPSCKLRFKYERLVIDCVKWKRLIRTKKDTHCTNLTLIHPLKIQSVYPVDSDVGDIVMLVTLWWWLISDVGDIFCHIGDFSMY